jgi:aconitate hydratase
MAASTLSQQLLARHLACGTPAPGNEIGLIATQALLTDVLGTLVILELEAMGIDRVRIGLAAQYVDHNLLEVDNLNAEEHQFLLSACRKYGIWYARAGTGISHPVHMEQFARPGELLVGCDSHTCAGGSMGMLAIGMGGIDVALAMAGEPIFLSMPEIWGVRLGGALPDWVSAKDVILEMLRRHGVEGGAGRIIEYYGPGVASLSAMDRHVIANMGAEMGATTSLFPSDERTRAYLASVGRADDWQPLTAGPGATYDHHDDIDLAKVEPMIARPSSPGNVVRVRDLEPTPVYQSYIGSSANPGYRDFAVTAAMVEGRTIAPHASLDINPSSRRVLQQLVSTGAMGKLIAAGGRIHQPGCNGCIGMGQAPAKGRPSLRTVPRNFPGRSGTPEDSVYLCSPETAAASALTGVITDPRDLGLEHPAIEEFPAGPAGPALLAPLGSTEAAAIRVDRTDNVAPLPTITPLPGDAILPMLLKVGNNVSTDEILPAGNEVMPLWTNFPKVSRYVYRDVDRDYPARAEAAQAAGRHHIILGGNNYGQGSSRENAALVPAALGLGIVIAKSFARIHWQNLVNFGVLPLTLADPADYDRLAAGQSLVCTDIFTALRAGLRIEVRVHETGNVIGLHHSLSVRQLDLIEAGGAINRFRAADIRPARRAQG